MTRYRWRVTRIGKPDRMGRWCDTREQAVEAAIRAGMAKRYPDGSHLFDALTRIEADDAAR
jgi:hypothetical protein